ncbi:MAG: hypothetical protein GX282_06275, partial [Campylobacteraceae bacterium]|nr:hypothetical protein [Campylobacteraceae bacterium]
GTIKVVNDNNQTVAQLDSTPLTVTDKNGNPLTSINEAINTLDAQAGELDKFAVKYDDDGTGEPDKTSITLGGPNAAKPTAIKNLASGLVDANGDKVTDPSKAVSTNAVNAGDLNKVASNLTNTGLNFIGDDGTSINKKLGETLSITGGATGNLTSGNIGVVAGTNGLVVKLAENIDLGANGSINIGDTILNNGGITITGGKDGNVTLSNKGLNNGGNQITNVASGMTDENGNAITDIQDAVASNAATMGDLQKVDSAVQNITGDISNITNTIGGPNNKYVDENGNLTDEGKQALVTNAPNGQREVANNSVIEAINNLNRQGTKFFHVNDGTNEADAGNISTDDSQANKKGAVGVGMYAKADGSDSIAMGTGAEALGDRSISIGTGNIVRGDNSGAIGDPSIINAANSYSVGNHNTIGVGADGSFVLGNNVNITKADSTALGNNSSVTVAGGVALGSSSVADRTTETNKDSVYMSDYASVADKAAVKGTVVGTLGVVSVGSSTGTRHITNVAAGKEDSDAVNVAQLKALTNAIESGDAGWVKIDTNVAIPANKPVVTGSNSVAIGPSSNDYGRPNVVSVGSAEAPRQITNVAAGTYATDAVNVAQLQQSLANVYGDLNKVQKDSRAGTASAIAIGNLPQATIPGKGMVSLGAGYYESESAIAFGLSKMSDDGRWVGKASLSYDSRDSVGAGVSLGYHW